MYILQIDEDRIGSKSLALAWRQAGKHDSLLGIFRQDGTFWQYDNCDYTFDEKDCRKIVEICDQIVAGKFDQLYATAEQ